MIEWLSFHQSWFSLCYMTHYLLQPEVWEKQKLESKNVKQKLNYAKERDPRLESKKSLGNYCKVLGLTENKYIINLYMILKNSWGQNDSITNMLLGLVPG